MAISQSNIQYESRSLEDFEALEQTCRLRPLYRLPPTAIVLKKNDFR
jgi:hypothetical protein